MTKQQVCIPLFQVKIPPMMEIITAEQLMEYLGECWQLLDSETAALLKENSNV